MILVDTSVWIEFLKGSLQERERFCNFAEKRQILVLECIIGELLQGVKSKTEKKVILQYWNLLPSIDMDSLWIKAGILSAEEKLTSKGIGLIDDVIIAACHETKSMLWTFDKKIISNFSGEILLY